MFALELGGEPPGACAIEADGVTLFFLSPSPSVVTDLAAVVLWQSCGGAVAVVRWCCGGSGAVVPWP